MLQQAEEWSRALFKCIRPVGEQDFSLNGTIGKLINIQLITYIFFFFKATQTLALHLDMTQLDLSDSKPYCTRNDLIKYRRLGLTVEEIVEVAMKLYSLRNLGINLKIEG